MHWSMRGTLFFLSVLLFLSCESNQDKQNSNTFDLVENIDSVFSLAHEWSGKVPPIPNELLDSIDLYLDSIKVHPFDNSHEPNAITFSANRKSQFNIFEETTTLKNLNKVSYQSYTVWRSIIENKEILEFSLQPHPTLSWTFTIRKRGQE